MLCCDRGEEKKVFGKKWRKNAANYGGKPGNSSQSLILKLTSWKLTVSKIQITFYILHRARIAQMASDN